MATSAPIAPRPITPSFFPLISWPANAFFAFSTSFAIFGFSFSFLHHSIPPAISRDDSIRPAITSSFTPFALAPGVLNTTMPRSAQASSGMLFTPAPARATARRFSENSISCMDALLTRIPSASAAESTISYSSGNSPVPSFEIGLRQCIFLLFISVTSSASHHFACFFSNSRINSTSASTPSIGIAL